MRNEVDMESDSEEEEEDIVNNEDRVNVKEEESDESDDEFLSLQSGSTSTDETKPEAQLKELMGRTRAGRITRRPDRFKDYHLY